MAEENRSEIDQAYEDIEILSANHLSQIEEEKAGEFLLA